MLSGMDITTITRHEYTTERVAKHTGSLEGCYDDFHIGEVNGVVIYIGTDYAGTIDPANHPLRFSDYSAKEMKGFQEYWGHWDAINKHLHHKTTKAGWGLINLVVYGFVNGIQIGEPIKLLHAVPTGFTPEANRLDTGELVWVEPEQAVMDWLNYPDSQPKLHAIAEAKRKEAVALFTSGLDLIQPLATLIK
jgi:hypothetical protein